MPPILLLHASDLAACAGRNPYRTRREALLKYVKRDGSRDAYRLALGDAKDPDELVRHAIAKLAPDASDAVQALSVDAPDAPAGVHERLERALAVCDGAPDLEDAERSALVTHCRSAAFTTFGTRQEPAAASLIRQRELLGPGVLFGAGDGTYHKRYLFSVGDRRVFIGGRVDGMASDGRVVEIKNRVNRLFNRVVEYERVQALAYGFVFGGADVVLVERMAERTAVHAVPYDAEAWAGIVADLRAFVQEVLDLEARARSLHDDVPPHAVLADDDGQDAEL